MGFAPESASTTAPASSAMAIASNDERTVGSAPVIRSQREEEFRSVGSGSVLIQTPTPHQQTQLGSRHRAVEEIADDTAFTQHQNAVTEVQHLVEIEGDEEDATTLVTLGDELLVDELDRSHIEAPGRLDGEESVWFAMQLAGDDQFLLVSSGERTGGDVRGGSANVERSHQPFSQGPAAGVVDPAARAEWRLLGIPQEDILSKGKGEHQPAAMAVLRDVGRSHAAARVWAGPGDVLALQEHTSPLRPAQAEQHLDQLGLSIALDAANTQNLTAAQLEIHPVERGMPLAPLQLEFLGNEHGLARMRRWTLDS